MNIAICGLGLMGGSLARALKAKTSHTVWGYDTNASVMEQALNCRAIDKAIDADGFSSAGVTFACLFSEATVEFLLHTEFKENSVVADICGVKRFVVDTVDAALHSRGIRYVGTHPMAGRECSGFASSLSELFDGASFIITKTPLTDEKAIALLKGLAESIGFRQSVVTTPAEHDKSIAFTSQLAHVVSNAYIKSPTLSMERGFSAGSFLDLTRVAKLDENMWTPLFLENRDNLIYELETITSHIEKYTDALKAEDAQALHRLLKEGRILKENSLK